MMLSPYTSTPMGARSRLHLLLRLKARDLLLQLLRPLVCDAGSMERGPTGQLAVMLAESLTVVSHGLGRRRACCKSDQARI